MHLSQSNFKDRGSLNTNYVPSGIVDEYREWEYFEAYYFNLKCGVLWIVIFLWMRMLKTCIPQREKGFFLCKFGEEEQSGNNTDAVF